LLVHLLELTVRGSQSANVVGLGLIGHALRSHNALDHTIQLVFGLWNRLNLVGLLALVAFGAVVAAGLGVFIR